VDLTRKEQARLHVVDAIQAIYFHAQQLPVPGYYVSTQNGSDIVSFRHPGSERVSVFLPPSVFEERMELSDYGKTVIRPATDEEWETLLRHLPWLLR
jgi:hypothetical protein